VEQLPIGTSVVHEDGKGEEKEKEEKKQKRWRGQGEEGAQAGQAGAGNVNLKASIRHPAWGHFAPGTPVCSSSHTLWMLAKEQSGSWVNLS
jgi:hypothetical protein